MALHDPPSAELTELRAEFRKVSDPERAARSAQYFRRKLDDGEREDQFLGLPVPLQRHLAAKYRNLALPDLGELLRSPVHEHRLTGLFILCRQFSKAKDESAKRELVDFYLRHLDFVNHWDLIDSSAPYVLGEYLKGKPNDILFSLASSTNWCSRRLAILASGASIKENDFGPTLALAELLLHDSHDLVQKGVGWMLREVGKKSEVTLKEFLDRFAGRMPRTMLRYALEKLPEDERRHYLEQKSRESGKSQTDPHRSASG